MATFVLVHGAWLGGWCWTRVVPTLRAADHDVFTPTLTGLGDREHLANPQVGLDTHIQDIVNVLHYEDMSDVVLVGHSYGGLVVTAVAAQAPERVRELIYVAAVVPSKAGESLFDQGGQEYRETVEAQAGQKGDGWRWPLPTFYEIEQFASKHGLSLEDQEWFRSKAVPQPVKAFADPAPAGCADLGDLRKVYIRCTGDYGPIPEFTQDTGWRYRELDTGHWPMFTRPEELSAMLLQLA